MLKRRSTFWVSGLVALFVGVSPAAEPQTGFNYAITHHALTISLDLDQNSLSATDRLTLKRLIKKPPTFTFILNRELTISELTLSGTAAIYTENPHIDPSLYESRVDSENVHYYQRVREIVLTIPEDLQKAKELELVVSYSGILHDEVESSQFSREYVADEINAFISRQGVYLGPEAIYYPTLSGQLFSFDASVTVPEPFNSMMEGKLEATESNNAAVTETWNCPQLMDGFHIVAGQYQIESLDHNGVTIATYFFPEQADLSERYLTACKKYLDLYTELLGPYPYAKFAVVDNFFASGYGMPSFTLLGSQVLRLPFIVTTSLGHEICHNWWGNSVYVDYESGNWCEGLTTYCADYLYKERESLDAAKEYRVGILRDYAAYTDAVTDFPLVKFIERHNPAQRAVGYGKSAMVYHMLRKYIGEDDFWRSLRTFNRDNAFKHTSWIEVQSAFEKETALKLQWYFDQWVMRSGAPALTYENAQKVKTEKGWEISFTLHQTQDGEGFQFQLPVLIGSVAQQAHLTADVKEKSQLVKLETIFEPTSFSIDPNFDLFRRLSPAETPPVLADVYGKSVTYLVTPSSTTPELAEAYGEIAKELMSRSGDNHVVTDYEFNPEEIESGAIIFLGSPSENQAIPHAWLDGEQWRMTADGFLAAGEMYVGESYTLVASARVPNRERLAIGFVVTGSTANALQVAPKLKHYGKYSYLVFRVDQNVAKGFWKISSSPLTHNFE